MGRLAKYGLLAALGLGFVGGCESSRTSSNNPTVQSQTDFLSTYSARNFSDTLDSQLSDLEKLLKSQGTIVKDLREKNSRYQEFDFKGVRLSRAIEIGEKNVGYQIEILGKDPSDNVIYRLIDTKNFSVNSTIQFSRYDPSVTNVVSAYSENYGSAVGNSRITRDLDFSEKSVKIHSNTLDKFRKLFSEMDVKNDK